MKAGIWGRGSGYSSWRFEPTDRGIDTFTFPSNERIGQLANEALGTAPGGEGRLLGVDARYDSVLLLRLRAPVKGQDVRDKLVPKIEEETVRNV